jgi:hypothetical protein
MLLVTSVVMMITERQHHIFTCPAILQHSFM